jgi:hypothetical protein
MDQDMEAQPTLISLPNSENNRESFTIIFMPEVNTSKFTGFSICYGEWKSMVKKYDPFT